MARVPVELSPEVVDVLRASTSSRFTPGAVKSAVRWAISEVGGPSVIARVPTLLPRTSCRSPCPAQEHRSVESVAWEVGPVRVAAEVAEHVIYDGATPGWTVLSGSVVGVPGGATVSINATLRVQGDRSATLLVIRPR